MVLEEPRRWSMNITYWLHFRNPSSTMPVAIQSFMVLAAILILIGLAYVFILVFLIGLHHYIFDRDPKKVPKYVKDSIQFSSESENEQPKNLTANEDSESTGSDDDEDQDRKNHDQKAAKLKQFMKAKYTYKRPAANQEAS